MSISTIYKATNKLNGKCYIGFDSNWPSRKNSHYYNHRSKRCPNYHFYSALKKYGWNNFSWEILYQSKDIDFCLETMEKHFITEYDSFRNGYNSTLGGQGSFGKLQSLKNKTEQSKRRSLANKQSKWYNNGTENKFSTYHPGDGWSLGRLNQNSTTNGCKWFNNGYEQKLTRTPPEGWVLGMLPKRKRK